MSDDVEVAKKALEAYVADPTAFSPEDIAVFSDIVEKAKGGAPKGAAPELSTPLTRNPEPPNVRDLSHSERTTPSKFDLVDSGHGEWRKHVYDENAATASKVRELVRDPEYHPPIDAHSGFVDSLLHPLDSIEAARQTLPHFLGGSTEHMYEPSVEQFRRDMAGKIPNVEKLDEDSIQYRMYADAQWANAYDQAKTDGRSVARHSFVSDKSWAEKARNAAVSAAGAGAAATHGIADMMTLGIAPRALDAALPNSATGRRNVDEVFPASHTTGELAGGVLPGGAAQEIAGGLGGLAKGLAPGAVNAVPRVLRAGATGATIGAADTLGRAGVGALAGDQTDWNQTGKDAVISMLLGGAMGAGADALGAGAAAHGRNLRTSIPELPVAEGFGGRTSVLSGFDPGPRYGALKAEGAAMPGGQGPVGVLAQRLEQPLAERGSATALAGKEAAGAANSKYYAETQHTTAPVDPLLDKATELYSGLLDANGNPLPGQHSQAANMLRSEINKMADLRLAPAGPGTLSFAEAERMGFDTAHLLKGVPEDEARAIRSGELGVGIHGTPRSYNPQQTDQIIRGLDSALKAAQGPGGGPHPELNSLLEASRAVRDQFPDSATIPGGNWSKFKHDISLRQAADDRAFGMAGVPGATRGDLTASEGKQLFNTVAGFGDKGRHPEVDATLQRFAGEAGGNAPQNLEDIRRVKAVERLEPKTDVGVTARNGYPMTRLSLESARLRADPVLQRIAQPTAHGGLRGGTLGGAAGAYDLKERGAQPPLTMDEINRLLNPNEPY